MSTARILLAIFCLLSGSVHAQSWPARPLRAIVPSSAGTTTDLTARALGQAWAPSLGQPLVVENRVGANGIIGSEACAKAPPDGYMLCFLTWGQMSANPFMFVKLPYDPAQDFAPVVKVSDITSAIAVHASMPAHSMKELLDLARAKPSSVTWAHWGSGSPGHLYVGWIEANTGVKFLHVPYKETVQAWNALVAGQSQAMANATGTIAAMVKAGKVKAVGLIGTRRSSFLPNVPTLREQGLDFQMSGWIGLLVQSGVPRDIVQRLNAEANRLIADPAFAAKAMLPLGTEPVGGTPEEFAAFLKQNRAQTGEVIKLANIKPQ